MSSAFATIVARDLRLAARRRVEALLPIAFFLVAVCVLFAAIWQIMVSARLRRRPV